MYRVCIKIGKLFKGDTNFKEIWYTKSHKKRIEEDFFF